MKILVVDDEPDLRYILRRIFTRAGHEVTEARHGAAALQAIAASRPDLVVTDMMMPVMGGAELMRRLRVDPVTVQIPIIAATGDAQLAGAADVVLRKPYRLAELLAAADTLLQRKANHE